MSGFILPPPKKQKLELPIVPPVSDFPSDVLKWIKKNNNIKPKMVLKFMQICKYFQCEEFPYFPVINLWGLCRADGLQHWSYIPLGQNVTVHVKTFPKPLWIIDSIRLTKFDKLPKTAICELYTIVLAEVDMSLKEFAFLTAEGKVSQLYLSNSVIRDEDGGILPFETIFEYLPNINSHKFTNSIFSYQESAIFGNQTPRPERYNIEDCFNFFKKNQHIFFNFSIYGEKEDEFVQRLQAAADALIQAWSPKNKPPVICFADQSRESKNALQNLENLFKKQKS